MARDRAASANLVVASGTVDAPSTPLLSDSGLDFSMVERVIITGGFGQYLNIAKAVAIGLLPHMNLDAFPSGTAVNDIPTK